MTTKKKYRYKRPHDRKCSGCGHMFLYAYNDAIQGERQWHCPACLSKPPEATDTVSITGRFNGGSKRFFA